MSWNLKFTTPPPPTTPVVEITEKNAATIRAQLISSGNLEFAIEHGLAPKAALAEVANFITEDSDMQRMKAEVVSLADLDESVIIFGESGTGKETIARALHGDRAGQFVAINCAAMPEALLESELFGHVAGAFTDAKLTKSGLLETARGGTIFLDEIGEMPMKLQAKMLRALQEKKIRKVGGTTDVDISCRVVSATNRPLHLFESGNMTDAEQSVHVEMLKSNFRLDLYWRLATYKIHITPLRERRDDIRELLDAKYDKDHLLTEEERDELVAKPLYGNCRELEALVKRAVLRKTLAVTKRS